MLDIKSLNVASHVIVRYFLMLENVRHNENIMHIDFHHFLSHSFVMVLCSYGLLAFSIFCIDINYE
jgi:hypothetical protein